MSAREVAGTVERPMAPWACRWPGIQLEPGCCGFQDPPVAVEAHQFSEHDSLWLAGILHGVECVACAGLVQSTTAVCAWWVNRFPPTAAR